MSHRESRNEKIIYDFNGFELQTPVYQLAAANSMNQYSTTTGGRTLTLVASPLVIRTITFSDFNACCVIDIVLTGFSTTTNGCVLTTQKWLCTRVGGTLSLTVVGSSNTWTGPGPVPQGISLTINGADLIFSLLNTNTILWSYSISIQNTGNSLTFQ